MSAAGKKPTPAVGSDAWIELKFRTLGTSGSSAGGIDSPRPRPGLAGFQDPSGPPDAALPAASGTHGSVRANMPPMHRPLPGKWIEKPVADPPESSYQATKKFLSRDYLGRDEPDEYTSAVRRVVRDDRSTKPTQDLVDTHSRLFDGLKERGIGASTAGNADTDGFRANSFRIPRYPEQTLANPKDFSYHDYSLLTYLGPVDKTRGITKDFVVEKVLRGMYSFPGKGISPVKADFSGKSQVYAVSPVRALFNDRSLQDPAAYTYDIGIIEQTEVPDGVLNMTTEKHKVYPGTIRRTVIERDGHLFMFTSGVGTNRFDNTGSPTPMAVAGSPFMTATRYMAQKGFAWGNDRYGPDAFRALDMRVVEHLDQLRQR